MTLQLGGGGAITGCTFLQEPDLIVSGLTVNGDLDAPKMIVASGTAAAPSYTFSGDTDNGLYYAGTNSIGLSTAGTNAILIDSSGRLLVATTVSMQTASTLQVSRLNGNGILTLGRDDASVSAGNGIGAIDFYGNVGGTYQQCSRILALAEGTHALGNKPTGLAFYTNSGSASATERMRIDSSGNVGVGTTLVDKKFVIAGDNTTGGENNTLRFVDTDTSSISEQTTGKIEFYVSDESGPGVKGYIAGITRNNGGDGCLTFGTGASGAATEKLRLDDAGRLGLGTTNPGHKLTVAEDDASTNAELAIDYTGASTGRTAMIRFQRGGTNFGYIAGATAMLTTGNADDLGIAPTSGKNLLFGIGSSEKARIDSSGRLLVGTSSAIGHGVDNHDTITAVSTAGGGLLLGRNDITTVDGNNLGKIQFWGNDDNGTYQQCASIIAEADGTHATNDKPTRLMFSTTADGASSPTERLRINSIGRMTGHGVNINQVFALLYARIYNHGGCNINGPSADFTDFDSGLAAFTTVQRTVTSAPTNYSFIGDNHGNAFSFFVGCGGNGSFGTSNASNDANNYSSWVCIHNLFVAALNGLPTNATRTSLP